MKKYFDKAVNSTAQFLHVHERIALQNRLIDEYQKAKASNNRALQEELGKCIHAIETIDNKWFWRTIAISVPAGIALHFVPISFLVKLIISLVAGFGIGMECQRRSNKEVNATIASKLGKIVA